MMISFDFFQSRISIIFPFIFLYITKFGNLVDIHFSLSYYLYLQNITYFQLPTEYNTNISSVYGWSKLTRYSVRKKFIPERIPPVFVGDVVSDCIPLYKMDEQIQPEYTFLRNSIMLHAGFYITPKFFLRINELNFQLKEKSIIKKVKKMDPILSFNFSDTKNSQVIENGIAIQHPFAGNYYHILLEILPMFFLLDHKIIRNSNILFYKDYPVGFNRKLFERIFNFFGLYPKAFTDISKKPILVKNLLIFKPRKPSVLDYDTVLYLRKYIFSKYYKEILESQKQHNKSTSFPNHPYEGCDSECERGLDQIMQFTPFRFVFFQRLQFRTIRNRKELIRALNEKYPKVTFETQPMKKGLTLSEQIIFYHETILLMGMHEGGFANILFMLHKTVVIEFAMNQCYHSIYTMTQLLGLHLYSLRFNYTSRKHSSVADIPIVLEAFDKAIKIIDQNFNTHYSA